MTSNYDQNKADTRRLTSNMVFTPAEIRLIRAKLAAREATPRELAALWGVGRETIARIGRRETYAWVSNEDPAVPDTQAEVAASLTKLQELNQGDDDDTSK